MDVSFIMVFQKTHITPSKKIEMDKHKKEVITRRTYLPGSTRSSLPQAAVGSQALTAAMHAAGTASMPAIDIAATPGIPEKVQNLLDLLNKGDAVESIPSPVNYFNDEPKFPAFGAMLKEPWSEHPDSIGAFDTDWERAFVRSMGEAIERSCQSHPGPLMKRTVIGSYNDHSDSFFDPVRFFPFSRGPLWNKMIYERELTWFPAYEYHSGKGGYVPMVCTHLYGGESDNILNSIRTSNGTAMWDDEKGAIFKALCEVIERDAFFIHYLGRITPPRIDPKILSDPQIKRVVDKIRRYRLDIHLFDITIDSDIPVVMCILIDRSGIGPAVALGSKCCPIVKDAVIHSLLEAVQIRHFSRMLWSNGKGTSMMDERAIRWYGRDNVDKLDFFLGSENFIEPNDHKGSISGFLDEFEHDIFVSDITQPWVEGYQVIKVNVPDHLPLYFDDAFKPLNIPRVMRLLDGKEINSEVHPFL